ncbi:MAG TPA: hypothetical protein VHK28_03515 [Candidatus Limnocylindria bacterium]|nr:hypothetical protein [Candidatus Limnocylindria bacterium]
MDVDLDELRQALLGEPPYPSGWEAQVEEIMETVRTALDASRLPDMTGMDPVQASCAAWRPMVGNTLWANGAFLERRLFIAHLTALAGVAPDEIRPAVEEALHVSAEAAAEQMRPDGDQAVISRAPKDEIRTIGLWAVEHCDLPVVPEEMSHATDWTDEQIAQSCESDRRRLEDGQEEYRSGPGEGRYALHPHALEVTLEIPLYPLWHQFADVDNDANPPTFEVEPIPGGFCDV